MWYTQNMHTEWKAVTDNPQVTRKLKEFAKMCCACNTSLKLVLRTLMMVVTLLVCWVGYCFVFWCWCLSWPWRNVLWCVCRSCMCICLTKCLWWLAAAVTLMPHRTRSIDSQLLWQTSQCVTTLMLFHLAKARSETLSVSCRLVRYLSPFCTVLNKCIWPVSVIGWLMFLSWVVLS